METPMSEHYYDRDDLLMDLNALIKAGLVDFYLRDDGEWVYKATKKATSMSEEELLAMTREDDE